MSADDTSGISMNRRVGDDKLERILTQLTELTAEVKHLNQRMDSRSAEIGKLTERVSGDKYERIMTQYAEPGVDMRHISQCIDEQAVKLEKLTERVNAIDVRLAVNEWQTGKSAGWIDHVLKGICAMLIGYAALRLGLK